MHEDEGRRRHYGHFYGLEDLPEGDLLLVWGNCQGESYRRLLGGEPGTPLHGADLVSVCACRPPSRPSRTRSSTWSGCCRA
ncbi:hypothetical protein ACUJ8O_07390 [Micrococcus sp. EWR3.9.1]|uniref:hypothetical protein n=1 Tax=Micrococcus sp. EWR3.9.1 TaxID=3461010 RepID=UPI004041ECA1